MCLMQYGFKPELLPADADGIPARITATHRDRYALVCERGEAYGRLKTKEYYEDGEAFPTTGDYVLIDYVENGDSRIIRTLPRRTFFSRRDPSAVHHEQLVAANFDYVFILQSLNRDFNLKRLERYLTLAWQSGAEPVIVLTKADLTEDCTSYILQAEQTAPGVSVYAVSAKNKTGLQALSWYFEGGKTTVLLGSSGVGKSSLVNALAGIEIMDVNGIREDDSRGRHTTTHRQLVLLPNGGLILDTPGMRELGMFDVSAGLGETFADVKQYLGCCRFADCRHRTEPGCAIKAAISSGELSIERWESYSKLREEATYTDDRASYLERKRQWHKSIMKNKKQSEAAFRKFGASD